MNSSLFLFLIGVLGFIFTRKNIILMFIYFLLVFFPLLLSLLSHIDLFSIDYIGSTLCLLFNFDYALCMPSAYDCSKLLGDINTDISYFLSGSKGYPDNFMDLSSSSGGYPDNFMDLSSSTDNSSNVNQNDTSVDQSIDKDKSAGIKKEGSNSTVSETSKLNPPSGETKSSTIPQTEFEKKPYFDNKPLPKSISDPNTLGKELND